MKNYTPSPVDTSGVELPEDILELTEKIAENVHEVWASNRQKEGWRILYEKAAIHRPDVRAVLW